MPIWPIPISSLATRSRRSWLQAGVNPTHAPDASKAEKDPAGSPNFFADFDAPVPFEAVADFAVRTLFQVFEVAHPDQLVYNAFHTEGGQLSFPGLCRRRSPTGRFSS
jgi:hypothetical protein